ncbi:MAG: protein kinase [Gimesia chilikensis]|uniref:protein kinase domain-containing protein n=1 Tax=Gimesia chilikensis TaxID=2605989 RepID=UPI0037B17674
MENCLSDNQIHQYLVHDLNGEDLQRYSEHLNECGSCQKRIEIQSEDDELKVWYNCHRQQAQEEPAEKHAFTDERIDKLFRSTFSSIHQSRSRSNKASDQPAANATSTLPLPEEAPIRTIGNYHLIEQIGKGGMGAVYRATHSHLKKQVVVKLILNNRVDDETQVQRFYREMEVIGSLDHANIVKATDAGEIDGTCFLVMEYLDGHDVKSILNAEKTIPLSSACYILRQVANGLQYIHNHQLIHRDIKPSNLFLTSDGQVKILDLGLAGLKQGECSDLTDSNCIMGSVYYMAPEQAQNVKNIDQRADIYSLGCAFYQMLTGRPPFKKTSQLETIIAHRETPPPHLRVPIPNIPPEIEDLFQSMMKKDPEERIQTMAEVVEILDHFLYQRSELPLSESSETRFTESQELKQLCTNARLSPAIEALQQTATTQYRQLGESAPLRKRMVSSSIFIACALGVAGALIWLNNPKISDNQTIQTAGISTGIQSVINPELERKAAVWFLKHRCELLISGENTPISQVESLPDRDFSIIGIDFKPQPITPELLAPLKNLSRLEALNMYDCRITTGSLQSLENMGSLLKLDLHNTGITDADLAVVSSLKSLTNLSIHKNPKLTDQGLQHLSALQNLESVNLARLNTSDKGLQFLQTNSALNWLNLEDTKTSDASVPALKTLQSMDKLYLKNSNVTEQGFQEIKNSLQNARVLSY